MEEIIQKSYLGRQLVDTLGNKQKAPLQIPWGARDLQRCLVDIW